MKVLPFNVKSEQFANRQSTLLLAFKSVMDFGTPYLAEHCDLECDIFIYIYICVCVCVYVCACLCKHKNEEQLCYSN
jgi:hypothetical protein